MIRLLAGLAATLLAAAAAEACPQVTSKTGALQLTTRQLATPRTAEVRAGGTVVLAACETLPGTGHVPFEPSAVIDYTADLPRRALEFRSEGACDAVLLVRTPRGNWYFDDDNGRGGNARLVLANPASGRYRLWVGSYDAFGCDARLVMRAGRLRPDPGR